MTQLKTSNKSTSADVLGSLIPIGAVSKATGINASTLRIWEQRYGVPKPHRTEGGARRYAPNEVQRLKLIKALVDIGHKPSNLSSLSIDELAEHLNLLNPDRPPQLSSTAHPRILSVGEATGLKTLFHDEHLLGFEHAHHVNDPVEINEWLGQFDALIFNYSALQADHAQHIIHWCKGLRSVCVLVIYAFCNSSTIQSLEAAGINCLKSPAQSSDIRHALDSFKRTPYCDVTRTLEKKFSLEDLETISSLDYRLYCECPRHLAGLLVSLNGFVSYSEQCLNASPKDAVIHRFLKTMATDAIASIESGLELVLRAEDIALPDTEPQKNEH